VAGPTHSDVASFGSLLDILDDALVRRPGQTALGLRGDDGVAWSWTYRELNRRSKLVAFRLRRLGIEPGDRLVTWSASTPELPAVYFGAMRMGAILVPLDLHMTPDTVARIVARAEPRLAVLGAGRDAPEPGQSLAAIRTRTVAELAAEVPGTTVPAGVPPVPPMQGSGEPVAAAGPAATLAEEAFPYAWEAQVDALPRPGRADPVEIVYTSGTTGTPKGVVLTHHNILSSIDAFGRVLPPLHHRVVSLLPLSHLMEQAAALYYATLVGADILYIRSRNPRTIFEAIRQHRVTTLLVVPQVLELFWAALVREIDRRGQRRRFERARRIARHLPYAARRVIFRSVHRELGGGLRLAVSAGAFLPPALQRAWEDLGVVVIQGYGATECGIVACETIDDHPAATVGRTPRPIVVRLANDGEILVSGPTVFRGYWRDPGATAEVLDAAGWYHTGDVARRDARGNLVLKGRTKNVMVLPSGLNVFPEDIENALHVAGLPDTVVVETSPGRIEAIVLAPDPSGLPRIGDLLPAGADAATDAAAVTGRIESVVRAANRTLAVNQRVAGWRLWPDADFPRTHTYKIRRDLVQAWAASGTPLPLVQTGT
jgi:long-chain acyl-CoA synthetase